MENCHVTAFSIDGNINTTDRMDTIIATSRLIPRERPYTMPITSGVAHPVTLCRSQDIVSLLGSGINCKIMETATPAHIHHTDLR